MEHMFGLLWTLKSGGGGHFILCPPLPPSLGTQINKEQHNNVPLFALGILAVSPDHINLMSHETRPRLLECFYM